MTKSNNVEKEAGHKTVISEEASGLAQQQEETIQLVVFRLGTELYGLDITSVKEVITVGKIVYLPFSPAYIAGIVNIRGNILSVTELRKIFDMPEAELTAESRLVVIEASIKGTGLLVDEVAEVLELPIRNIEPTLTTIFPEKAEYLTEEYRVDNKLIGILKAESILNKK